MKTISAEVGRALFVSRTTVFIIVIQFYETIFTYYLYWETIKSFKQHCYPAFFVVLGFMLMV